MLQRLLDRCGNLLVLIGQQSMLYHLSAIFSQLINDDWRESIFDPALIDFTASSDKSRFFFFLRMQFQQWLVTGNGFSLLHLLFLDDQRDNTRSSQMISLLYREMAGTGGNYHFS